MISAEQKIEYKAMLDKFFTPSMLKRIESFARQGIAPLEAIRAAIDEENELIFKFSEPLSPTAQLILNTLSDDMYSRVI